MNPAAAITAVITYDDGGDPNDADNATRRAFLLNRLQMINNYVHNFRPWEWTFKEGDVTVTVGQTSTALPTDFMEFSNEGAVHDAQGNEWVRKGRGFIERLKKQGLSMVNSRCFAIWDGKIQIPYTVTGSSIVFTCYYRRRPEVLADNSTTMLIPDRYYDTVILPGLTARAQESKQDARDSWFGYLREGLAQMCALENPMMTRGMRIPSAIRGG